MRLLDSVKLSSDLTPVYRIAATVAEHAEKLQTVELDVQTLNAALDEGVWKEQVAEHADEVARWQQGSTAARFMFAGAADVWKQWNSPRGILGELLRLLRANRRSDLPRVQQIADQLGDARAVDALIDETDRREVGRPGKRISGRARRQLEDRLDEVRKLALSWLHVMKARPDGTGFVERSLRKLRSDVERPRSRRPRRDNTATRNATRLAT